MLRVRVGSGVRARVGPALFITKLMMTYAAFTRYFTRPKLKLSMERALRNPYYRIPRDFNET